MLCIIIIITVYIFIGQNSHLEQQVKRGKSLFLLISMVTHKQEISIPSQAAKGQIV